MKTHKNTRNIESRTSNVFLKRTCVQELRIKILKLLCCYRSLYRSWIIEARTSKNEVLASSTSIDTSIQNIKLVLMIFLCLLSGCTQQTSSPPNTTLRSGASLRSTRMAAIDLSHNASKAEVTKIIENVLAQMHFEIEKLDPEAGYIKTRPLEGAQFFEFWRSDNAGAYNWLLSNLHSVRRTVEIILRSSQDASYGGRSDEVLTKQSSIDDKRETTDELSCIVQIQRLSMPEQEVTSSARAYAMFTRSSPGLQTLVLNPEQQKDMAWIDLGRDKELENEIIKRIKTKILTSD